MPNNTIKDSNGEIIKKGDTVFFSYGIPPVPVKAPIFLIDEKLYVSTPDHTPKCCLLSELENHVGLFTKVRPSGTRVTINNGFP